MSRPHGFTGGDFKRQCDRCGWIYLASQTAKEWNGLITCSGPGTHDCWEPRHPQDLKRGVPDRQNVPEARPEGAWNFLSVGDVTADDL